MNPIQIKALTPVHTGSGAEWQSNFEYLYFREEAVIAVIDPEKVLNILGEEYLPQWIACIEKQESLLALLQTRRPGLRAADVALRTVVCDQFLSKPVREQMRSGNGAPLLAGSSLKGAIRTALWAKLMLDNADLAKNRDKLGVVDRRGNLRWSDQPLSKSFFGNDPNHDIFRLLQVGDAAFTQTEIRQTDVVNQYRERWAIKNDLTQYVEVIPAGSAVSVSLHFNALLRQRAGNTFNQNAAKLELSQLFPLINQYTERLLSDEISYWEDKADQLEALDTYVQELERLLAIVQSCTDRECVLRLGWGSGFRFMTGDWHGAMTDDDYTELIQDHLRKGKNYADDVIFPKTLRLCSDGTPLGFTKLLLLIG